MELVGITVDSFVNVHLTVAQSAERDRLTLNFHQAFERWAATAKQTQDAPPQQPANRLMQITTTVQDNLGTGYISRARSVGGTGTEWEGTFIFEPRLPADIHELSLTLQAPAQPEISISARL